MLQPGPHGSFRVGCVPTLYPAPSPHPPCPDLMACHELLLAGPWNLRRLGENSSQASGTVIAEPRSVSQASTFALSLSSLSIVPEALVPHPLLVVSAGTLGQ